MNSEEVQADVDDVEATYMTQFIGELLNMAILDSGCTQSVCGKNWLNIYREKLPPDVNEALIFQESNRSFRFGDGEIVNSIGKMIIPIHLDGVCEKVGLETDIVDKDLPLLMSRGSMKRAETVISFNSSDGKEKVTMFGKQQSLYISASGHLCIPLSKFKLNNNTEGSNTCSRVLFTGKLEAMDIKQRLNAAIKLHEQFAHPSSDRLIKLLKDGGMTDKSFLKTTEEVSSKCAVCLKYKRHSLTPAVCFPRATEFNQNIAFDLKAFANKYMLHTIDHFTRYSRGIVINNKEADTIIDGLLKT